MTITKRLIFCFALIAGALCASVIYCAVALSHSQTRFEYVQVNTVPSIGDLDKTIGKANEFRFLLYSHALSRTPEQMSAVESAIARSLDELAALIEHYNKSDISDAKDQKYTDMAKADLEAVKSAVPDFLARSHANDDAATLRLLTSDGGLGAANRKLISDLNAQIGYNVELGDVLRSENAQAFSLTLKVLVVGALTIFLIVGLSAFRVLTHVRTSL